MQVWSYWLIFMDFLKALKFENMALNSIVEAKDEMDKWTFYNTPDFKRNIIWLFTKKEKI